MSQIIDQQQKEHFDKENNQYDRRKIANPAHAQLLEIKHLLKFLALSPPKKILDFGCGSGRMTIPLIQMGFDVCGYDISENSLVNLKSYYLKNRKRNWGKLITTNKLPNVKFDAVIGSDILHHVSIPHTLPRLAALLRKKGVLVFSEPNPFHLPWYLFILINLSWSVEKGILLCSIPNLKKQFTKAGLTNFSFSGHGLFPTRLFNFSSMLSDWNAFSLSELPILKYLAFRYIIKAYKQ